MLLVIFWCLISKITSVSGDWDVGTQNVNDFDWNKVGMSVFARYLDQVDLKSPVWFYILFLDPSTNNSAQHIRLSVFY